MKYTIDLRSDTVTKPTKEMFDSMYLIFDELGDDVYEEDETVQLLQKQVSDMFGKEDGLFFPSGTMCNLTSLLCWCNRGSEIILGNKSHIFLFEQGGAAQFGGVAFHTLPNKDDGTIEIHEIENAIRDNDIHESNTSLIAIENTHNACGGKILPKSFLHDVKELANKHDIPVHLDGARIWNALQEIEVFPNEIGCYVDSISVCLSKGLGAPIGSLLLGPKTFIQKAKRIRKALGGGMRQSGILAAAALTGIKDFQNGILRKDHERIKRLANALKEMDVFRPQSEVHTNILFVDLSYSYYNEEKVCMFLKEHDIFVSAWSKNLIRIVVHRNISDDDISHVINTFKKLSLIMIHV